MGAADYQIVSTVCLSSLAVLATVWVWKKISKDGSAPKFKPKKWAKVGNVKKLIIYPIKSCQGIEVEKAVLTELGFKFPDSKIRDRDFLLIDGNRKQLNMVNFPKMALVNIEVHEDMLTLTAPNMTPITFKCPEKNESNEGICTIKHDTNLKALDCGDDVATWFRKFLGDEHVRLVYHHLNHTQRTFLPFMYDCPQFLRSDLGSFQNATAYHLVAEEYIQELNTRLEKKPTYKNFRPTILIDGVNEPFAEVNWSYVKIGYGDESIFNVSVPCHRCLVTTVDQEVGVLTGDGEPLKTLRNMKLNQQVVDERLQEVLKNKGVFGLRLGLHFAAEAGSIINVGDPVYVAIL